METVLIAGGTGLIGERMTKMLEKDYRIKILTRDPDKYKDTDTISYHRWDIKSRQIDAAALQTDHIINLTGAGIADKRWSDSRKKVLIDSRVHSNETLLEGLKKSGNKVSSFVCASAIGYYADRGEEILTESSAPGEGFLTDCCIAWEKSAHLLSDFTNRLSIVRIGLVLSSVDGALPKMLMTKGIGVYPYFGDGSQYYSWIHIEDLCRVFITALSNISYSGVYNGVAPQPITNKNMMEDIKDAFGSGFTVPSPAFALRLAMGEMADVVLNSNRVIPQRLLDEDFSFLFHSPGVAAKDCVDRGV